MGNDAKKFLSVVPRYTVTMRCYVPPGYRFCDKNQESARRRRWGPADAGNVRSSARSSKSTSIIINLNKIYVSCDFKYDKRDVESNKIYRDVSWEIFNTIARASRIYMIYKKDLICEKLSIGKKYRTRLRCKLMLIVCMLRVKYLLTEGPRCRQLFTFSDIDNRIMNWRNAV